MGKIYWNVCCVLGLTAGLLLLGADKTRAQRISPSEYIERYKDLAIQQMNTHGCPASIILAIAMHESAHGNSRIANHLNNHFGIKGPNESKEIRSAYKGYPSVEDSYADFIDFLKRRKGTQQLFDQYSTDEYQKWVRSIARSGYAQSPTWSNKVIGMIRKYSLHEFDDVRNASEQDGIQLAANVKEPDVYVVKKGDTLSAIAKRHGTTIKAIQRDNGLSNSRLAIGQQLYL